MTALGVVESEEDAEAGFSKDEVRGASRLLGLPTSERPASPCLASRFPYGEEITLEALQTVARAESLLHEWGFPIVRVRHHGRLARIEVPAPEVPRLLDKRLRHRQPDAASPCELDLSAR